MNKPNNEETVDISTEESTVDTTADTVEDTVTEDTPLDASEDTLPTADTTTAQDTREKLTLRPALRISVQKQIGDVLREAGITLAKDVGRMNTYYDGATNVLNIVCRTQIIDVLEQGFKSKGFEVERSTDLRVEREQLFRQPGPNEAQ